DIETRRLLAVGLTAGLLAGLQRGEQALPQWPLGLGLEAREHRLDHAGANHGVRGGDHVRLSPMPRPWLVAGAGTPGGMPARVEAAELPALHVRVAGRDLLEGARRRATGAHQIESEEAEARI